MSTIIESIEQRQRRRVPRFAPGDRVRVHFQVVEGTRRRTQVFEGVVIARRGAGSRETFSVRKQSFGVGVERTFPVHSPKIERLEVVAKGDVRRAKLYYLRGRVGKRARVAERRWGIEEELLVIEDEAEAVDSEGVAQSEAEAIPATEDGEEGEAGQGEETQGEASPSEEQTQPEADEGAGGEAPTEPAEQPGTAAESTEPEESDEGTTPPEPQASEESEANATDSEDSRSETAAEDSEEQQN